MKKSGTSGRHTSKRAKSMLVGCALAGIMAGGGFGAVGFSGLALAQQPKPSASPTSPAPATPPAPALPKAASAGLAPQQVAPPAAPSQPAPPTPPSAANALIRPPGAPTPQQNVAVAAAQASAPAVAGGHLPFTAAPKPAPELDQMKVLEGSWRCDGRAPAGPSGPEHAYKSTWRFKRDLDNFWWAAEYQQSKAKNHPQPMKARGYLTYDPAAKTFVLMGVDNMGGSSTESTSGWSGDVVTLAGDASMAGKTVPYREVITKKGTREFTWRGEIKMGGDWVTLGEDRCKK